MSSLRLRLTHEVVEIVASARLLSAVLPLALLAATTACNVMPAATPVFLTSPTTVVPTHPIVAH